MLYLFYNFFQFLIYIWIVMLFSSENEDSPGSASFQYEGDDDLVIDLPEWTSQLLNYVYIVNNLKIGIFCL